MLPCLVIDPNIFSFLNFRLRIITNQVFDRIKSLNYKEEENAQNLHEVKEAVEDENLERDLELMQLEVERLKSQHKFEETRHRRILEKSLWE